MLKSMFLTGTMLLGASLLAAPPKSNHEYGVNIHAQWEYKEVPQEFAMLDEADIRLVRSDFSWRFQERAPGQWTFERLDAEMAEAAKRNLTVLPILGYAPTWGEPAQDKLDLWLASVEKNLERYGKVMPYWEIWNEHNYGIFWKNPNPKAYLKLLKPTFELIRKKCPDAQVVLGGTSQIPLQYLETFFKEGGGAYFDIMNVHPYNWYDIPEMELEKQLNDLKKLMAKYHLKQDIWITEIGWPTNGRNYQKEYLPGALKAAGIDVDNLKLAVVCDNATPAVAEAPGLDYRAIFPKLQELKQLTMDQIKDLDPVQSPVLIALCGETSSPDVKHADAMREYVKKGGLLIFPRGIPFYSAFRPGKEGNFERSWAPKDLRKKLRFDFAAWWLKREVPMPKFFQPEIAKDQVGKLSISKLYGANCHLVPVDFQGNDKLIPLIVSKNGEQEVPLAAYLKFDSDLKGGVIVSCINWLGMAPTSEELQAKMLPRTILISLKAGVKKVFWYEFQAMENNPNDAEHYFGIVHADLSPKPAFAAYRTLAKMRPEGSSAPTVKLEREVYVSGWKKPDGGNGYAVWVTGTPRKTKLAVTGAVSAAVDYLGKPLTVAVKEGVLELEVTNGITYIDGPAMLSVKE